MKKVRLDQLVFDQGLSESRERAKAIIMSGVVYVNGQRADKPGAQVAPDAKIEVRGNTLPYVSRGGFKLEKALKVFPIDPTGLTCIDCGASTGGFTDVLLQNGAAKVYAVDVGYGQLAQRSARDLHGAHERALYHSRADPGTAGSRGHGSVIHLREAHPAGGLSAAEGRCCGRLSHQAAV